MKLKVAELISSLADAKIAAAEINEIIRERDKKIKELEEAFALKSKTVRYRDAYYEEIEEGIPSSGPYCSSYWETSSRATSLLHASQHDLPLL